MSVRNPTANASGAVQYGCYFANTRRGQAFLIGRTSCQSNVTMWQPTVTTTLGSGILCYRKRFAKQRHCGSWKRDRRHSRFRVRLSHLQSYHFYNFRWALRQQSQERFTRCPDAGVWETCQQLFLSRFFRRDDESRRSFRARPSALALTIGGPRFVPGWESGGASRFR